MTNSFGSRLRVLVIHVSHVLNDSGFRLNAMKTRIEMKTHSAAMMIGIGREALPRAGTTVVKFDMVKFGVLYVLYCTGSR